MAENTSYSTLISDIKNNNIKNLYLFCGPETFLIDEVLAHIEKKILTPSFKSLNYVKLDGPGVTYDTLVNACETLPFMDEKKMVVVNDCIYFKSKKSRKDSGGEEEQSEDLCNYFSKIPSTTILILITRDEVDKRRKIYNCIKKNGYIADFLPLKNEELLKWVVKEFEKLKKTIDRTNALYFVDRVPGNLNDVLNEISKVCSYAGKSNVISRLYIDTVVSRSLELNIFQLVDSISSKNPDRALLILNELLLESEPVPVILSMIIRQYRLLLSTRLLTQKGYSTVEIAENLRLKHFAAANLSKLSKGLSEEEIQRRLVDCLNTDSIIKKGRMDQRIAIESLIVEFAK